MAQVHAPLRIVYRVLHRWKESLALLEQICSSLSALLLNLEWREPLSQNQYVKNVPSFVDQGQCIFARGVDYLSVCFFRRRSKFQKQKQNPQDVFRGRTPDIGTAFMVMKRRVILMPG